MPLPLKTHKQADTHIKLQLLKSRSFKSTEKENRQIAEPKPSRPILATAALRFVSYGSTPNMTSPLVNIKHFFPLFISSIFTPADVFLCTMLRVRVCVCQWAFMCVHYLRMRPPIAQQDLRREGLIEQRCPALWTMSPFQISRRPIEDNYNLGDTEEHYSSAAAFPLQFTARLLTLRLY